MRLLMCIGLLLLAVPASAVDWELKSSDGKQLAVCDENLSCTLTPELLKELGCAHRMAEAMKAIDGRWVNERHYLMLLYGFVKGYDNDEVSKAAYNRNLERLAIEENQWNHTMESCVK